MVLYLSDSGVLGNGLVDLGAKHPGESRLFDLSSRLHVHLSQLFLQVVWSATSTQVILFNFSLYLHLSFGCLLPNRACDLGAEPIGHLRMTLDPASIVSNTVLSPRKNNTANQANKQIPV